MIRTLVTLIVDDTGQDLLEYALLAGLIGVVGALIFPAIADEMGVAYDNWLTEAGDAWTPPDPSAPGP